MTRISGAVNLDFDDISINIDELEELAGKVLIHEFGTATIAPSVTTTLATHTVSTGKKVRIKGVFYRGDNDGLFELLVDGTVEWDGRNAWTERNTQAYIEVEAAAGLDIVLRATNRKNQSNEFSGGFYGYELNA